jgi:hypothetical protein
VAGKLGVWLAVSRDRGGHGRNLRLAWRQPGPPRYPPIRAVLQQQVTKRVSQVSLQAIARHLVVLEDLLVALLELLLSFKPLQDQFRNPGEWSAAAKVHSARPFGPFGSMLCLYGGIGEVEETRIDVGLGALFDALNGPQWIQHRTNQ